MTGIVVSPLPLDVATASALPDPSEDAKKHGLSDSAALARDLLIASSSVLTAGLIGLGATLLHGRQAAPTMRNSAGHVATPVASLTDFAAGHVQPLARAMAKDDRWRLNFLAPDQGAVWHNNAPAASRFLQAKVVPAAEPTSHHFAALEAKPVGFVSMTRIPNTADANLSYWFMKNTIRKKGLATASVAGAISKVFRRDPNIDRIVARIDPANRASVKLITRAQIAFRKASAAEVAASSLMRDGNAEKYDLYIKTRSTWKEPKTEPIRFV